MVSRKPQIVGKPFPRIEAQLKLTGTARYLDDLQFGPELLHAQLCHSTRPHALIKSIDLKKAKAIPGVRAILTGSDFESCLGIDIVDRPILARERVRYVGEPLAAAVAETLDAAKAAVAAISVVYKDLPPVLEIEESIKNGSELLHPDLENYEYSPYIRPTPDSNIAHQSTMQRGDLQTGWADSDIIIDHTYHVARVQHVPMETHGGVALVDDADKITLWASTQAPFTQRQMIAQALGINPERLRVVTPRVGGGFGSKSYASIEAIVVALALAVPGQPVKLILNRKQEFLCTFLRPGLAAHIKMGASRAGELTAVEARYYWNVGASADASLAAVRAAIHVGAGPYRVPNSLVESLSVYTNQPVAGPMRGNGMAEVHWAIEQHIDRLAEAVNIDPIEFRLSNCLRGGDDLPRGSAMHATGLDQCIRQAAETVRWSQPSRPNKDKHAVRGKGLAAMWNPVIITPRQSTTARIKLEESGTCTVSIGGVDTGQGLYTLAAQVVASEVGVPLDWVDVQPFDTDHSLSENPASRKQLTWSMGNAVQRAAQDVRRNVLAFVAKAWDEPIGNLDIIDGNIISYATERVIAMPELLNQSIKNTRGKRVGRQFVGEGAFTPDLPDQDGEAKNSALPIIHYSTGAQAIEVEIDYETGSLQLLHVASAYDVGHAINPDIVRAQIKGGVMQGLSTSMLEQVQFEHGHMLNPNLRDYRIATIKDLPLKVDPIIIEVPQDDGPYGARGIGEHALIPTAPAIANAIHHALGIRIDSLPITSERIWKALADIKNQPETS
ncbi:MAG: xanthine dehydrogenase family protein molybdopterin-binding subunit [Chloroflexi bacterium]|nr:xanthine dehydrogenase family protein molybdopterin-binding subunit [Chloroflexota bacterium]